MVTLVQWYWNHQKSFQVKSNNCPKKARYYLLNSLQADTITGIVVVNNASSIIHSGTNFNRTSKILWRPSYIIIQAFQLSQLLYYKIIVKFKLLPWDLFRRQFYYTTETSFYSWFQCSVMYVVALLKDVDISVYCLSASAVN